MNLEKLAHELKLPGNCRSPLMKTSHFKPCKAAIRSSIGGCVEKSAINPGPSLIPAAARDLGKPAGSIPPSRGQSVNHRRSAAEQLRRSGICTKFTLARKPGNDDRSCDAKNNLANNHGDHVTDAGGLSFSRLKTALSTIKPTTRERKITKVLTTP